MAEFSIPIPPRTALDQGLMAAADDRIEAPNRLRSEVSNDRIKRQYLYDGTTLTLFAERAGFYASIPAPPSIAQLMDKLDEKYDFSVPLEDLFRWDSKGWDVATQGRHGRGAERNRWSDLRAVRHSPGRRGLAGMDPVGRVPPAAKDRDHHQDRRHPAAALRGIHLESRALIQRGGIGATTPLSKDIEIDLYVGRQRDTEPGNKYVNGIGFTLNLYL